MLTNNADMDQLISIRKNTFRVGEAAQWIKGLATKSDNLGLICGPTWWKVRTSSYRLVSALHKHAVACMCPEHTRPYIQNKLIKM